MKKILQKMILLLAICLPVISYSQISATHQEVISSQKKGRIDTYISQNDVKFKVGDTITLGLAYKAEQYNFVMQNAGIEFFPLSNSVSGIKVVISKIGIKDKTVFVNTTKPQKLLYGLIITNFEKAILNGEIK